MSLARPIPPDPDKTIHEKARLRILVYLSSSGEPEVGFTEIKSALEMTAGNLSIQLGILADAGYVIVRKSFVGKKPYTGVELSLLGRQALDRYLGEMEAMLSSLRNRKN